MAAGKTESGSAGISPTADREIITTRVFNAPRELVFQAWTDPVHLARWFGPNGFSITTSKLDFRVGGAWVFVMHGPDGTDYPNRVLYTAIDRPARIAYWHDAGVDNDPARFENTVTFTDLGGRTRLTMHAVLGSPEELERVKAFGAEEGGRQTLERLEKYLMQAQT
jgi:uncharacterized protein YndB with AHSA1/START domain